MSLVGMVAFKQLVGYPPGSQLSRGFSFQDHGSLRADRRVERAYIEHVMEALRGSRTARAIDSSRVVGIARNNKTVAGDDVDAAVVKAKVELLREAGS
jgi:hypothetical protein